MELRTPTLDGLVSIMEKKERPGCLQGDAWNTVTPGGARLPYWTTRNQRNSGGGERGIQVTWKGREIK